MRTFKTEWFTRKVSSHGISDDELYQIIQSAFQGKVVDLGEGVYKERLSKNRDRTIILTKSAGYWLYTFLRIRQDMANISHRELAGFRGLAGHYTNLSGKKTTVLVKSKGLVETYNDNKK